MNEDAEVMANHLTQNFIDLGGRRLRPDRRAAFPLQHRESRLDVRAFVVMRPKLPLIELVKVKQLAPEFAAVLGNAASLESDVRHASNAANCFHIPLAQVSPISGDFAYRKSFGRSLHEWNELAAIAD